MDPDVLAEFLTECDESLDALEATLLNMEERVSAGDPAGSNGEVDAAFRAMHSIKGAAGFMDNPPLERVSHAAETVLGGIREGRFDATPAHLAGLLTASAVLRDLLAAMRGGPGASEDGLDDLLAELGALAADKPVPPAPTARVGGVTFLTPPAARPAQPSPLQTPLPSSPPPPTEPPASAAPTSTQAAPQVGSTGTVRVDVALLDDLMNLVGELVVCRNQILRVPDQELRADLRPSVRQLDQLTSHIQQEVMKTRMRPVGAAWGRLPRLVRDLARSCKKQCELVLVGEDVELDRSVLEHIRDPLAHMIRNAVDHGIELPEERLAAGKTQSATLLVRAEHIGGHVHITVQDDGRGLNTAQIRETAISSGMLEATTSADMSEQEIWQLVFEPGFSTASEVTRLSGRGVGMDVVRANLNQIGGTADIQSVAGAGTTVRLKIPLTLAILPALIVTARGHTFAIPQSQLVELIDLTRHQGHRVESIAGSPVLRSRGELLPLVYLDDTLHLAPCEDANEFVVVVQADDVACGLVVDSVEETEEIVVKPLGDELADVTAFSGATVRGDGSIALILDVNAVAKLAGVRGGPPTHNPADDAGVDTSTLLRFTIDGVGFGGVSLQHVIRIQDAKPRDIERHGLHRFVHWEGRVIPVRELIDLDKTPDVAVSLVICATANGPVAVAVSEVLDVIDTPVDLTPGLGETWASGMAVVAGVATAILDIQRVGDA